jgi:hypothetical protein
VFNAEHLRRILGKYATYYNEVRTHVSLGKDAPCRRPVERFGDIVAYPVLGGLQPSLCSNLVFGSDRCGKTRTQESVHEPSIWDVVITRGGSAKTGHQRMFALNCGVEKTQLGPNARISGGVLARSVGPSSCIAEMAGIGPGPEVLTGHSHDSNGTTGG